MTAQNKKTSVKNAEINLIVLGAVFITLSLTPWVNADSLIIPKQIILFCLAFFLIPKLVINVRPLMNLKLFKILILLSILFILQMVVVILTSDAPFEQEFYGRTGRSLGFATYFSLTIILLVTAIYARYNSIKTINLGIFISCLITSLYSILQYYGLDIFAWVTATNGIIGTLGNPNFQSSFAAMALLPTAVYFWGSRGKALFSIPLILILLYTLFICESTQGYIASAAAISIFILIYFYYKNKSILIFATLLVGVSAIVALAGMLNKGPLSYFLYKYSVISRGEMWQAAFSAANSNPIFGVGLDSFGDVSLLYRNEKTANGIAEYTDNAHNFFLQFALTGGYPLAILYSLIILLSLYAFYSIQRNINKFDKNFTALFSAWFCFQLQSFISPANISMLVWNFIICGVLIGCAFKDINEPNSQKIDISNLAFYTRPFSYFLLIFGLVVMYPYFNSDKLAWQSLETGDGLLAIKSAKMYPESSLRYQRIGLALFNSKLYDQSLDVARSAARFNPKSRAAWFLILMNEKAPLEERRQAKARVLEVDPFNKEALLYNF
jgi:O-antigen ligase